MLTDKFIASWRPAAVLAVSLLVASISALASGWPPFASNDQATVPLGGVVSVLDSGATSVLTNDFDIERDPLSAVLTKVPKHGDLTFNSDGTFEYRHDGKQGSNDDFRYRAFDGTGYSRDATVTIVITAPANTPPFVIGSPGDQEAAATKPFSLALAPYFGDTDEGDILSFSASGLPGSRNLTIDASSGVLSGTPQASDARDRPYAVTVTATDRGGLRASLGFELLITTDMRPDLAVTATLAANPVAVGETATWNIAVENQGPADLDLGELVAHWITSGPPLSLTAPPGCSVTSNDTNAPTLTCTLDGLVAYTTLSFNVRGTQSGDGDNTVIATAISDDPFPGNNAVLRGAQVVAQFGEGPTQMLSVASPAIAMADFNGDALDDLVTTAVDTVVFFNGGNRALKTPGTSLGAGSGGTALAVLDWNGDGNADIAVAGLANAAGRIYLGDGRGAFPGTIELNYKNAGTIAAAGAADFARDGYEDLVLTGATGSVLLRSNGQDGFTLSTLAAGPGLDLSIADFDNNAYADIAIVESADRAVRLLKNAGDGVTFNSSRLVRGSVAGVTATDVNGDGRADLLLAIDGADLQDPESRVLLQRSDGTFPTGTAIGASPLLKMLAGDVDGDSQVDIVALNAAGVHQVYLGKPGGSFELSAEQLVSDGMRRGVLVDFNKDQSLDLILAGNNSPVVEIHANNGIGRLGRGDRLAPVVKLNGESTLILAAGQEFVDPGATAIDDIDGDLTDTITTSGSVNTTIVGTYKISYSATDRAGNRGTVTRTIQVGVNEGTGGSGGGALGPGFVLLLALAVCITARRRRTGRC